MDVIDVRKRNLAALMRSVFAEGPATRSDLARKLKLTPMTVTNLVSELLSKGILEDVESTSKPEGRGRAAKTLQLHPESPVAAGIWMSKNHMYGVVTDFALNVLTGRRVEFEEVETAKSVLEKARELADYLLSATERNTIALGLALSGVVNRSTGTIERVVDFRGIETLPIATYLNEKLEIPVIANNMMHASAFAELYYGVGKDLENFIYLGLSDGVGAAIVSEGRVITDGEINAGEFGHTTIDYRGAACECGSRGCLELYASVPRLISAINLAAGTTYSKPAEAMRSAETNELAAEVVRNSLEKISFGLNSLVNLVSVFNIVVGDESYHLPDIFLEEMSDCLNEVTLFRGFHEISIQKSRFEDNGPIFGSVSVVMDSIFSGELSL